MEVSEVTSGQPADADPLPTAVYINLPKAAPAVTPEVLW